VRKEIKLRDSQLLHRPIIEESRPV